VAVGVYGLGKSEMGGPRGFTTPHGVDSSLKIEPPACRWMRFSRQGTAST
jgi:hypothetical protein